jgi:hypothetical protein
MTQYKIVVHENSHYMDKGESFELPQLYDDCESAITACMRIVDDFLLGGYRAGMTAEELWAQYTTFGEDPAIFPAGCAFSAWDYARGRCRELCRGS